MAYSRFRVAMAMSAVSATVTITAVMYPSMSAAGWYRPWGKFQAEHVITSTAALDPSVTQAATLPLESGSTVVTDPLAEESASLSGTIERKAVAMTSGRLKVLLYGHPERDAGATGMYLHVRQEKCGDANAKYDLYLDSALVAEARGVWHDTRYQFSGIELPAGVSASDGKYHLWEIRMRNPYAAKTCQRRLYVDYGGWWTIGSLTAEDLTIDAGSSGTLAANEFNRSTLPSMLTLTSGSASGTATAEFGDRLHVVARGIPCNGVAPKMIVRLGSHTWKPREVKTNEFFGHQFTIPAGITARDVQVTMADTTCADDAINLVWIKGTTVDA